MKLENVIRIYRRSYLGESKFYTILMDYSPWKVCYSGKFNPAENYLDPESLVNIDEAEFNGVHNAVSDIDPWIEKFFLANDVLKWRNAEEVIPAEKMGVILDGSSIGLIWKKDNILKEIIYDEGVYPKDIPFPECEKLRSLINYLENLRMK